MGDLIADWKRWSRGERILAVALALMMSIAIPLGLLISTSRAAVEPSRSDQLGSQTSTVPARGFGA